MVNLSNSRRTEQQNAQRNGQQSNDTEGHAGRQRPNIERRVMHLTGSSYLSNTSQVPGNRPDNGSRTLTQMAANLTLGPTSSRRSIRQATTAARLGPSQMLQGEDNSSMSYSDTESPSISNEEDEQTPRAYVSSVQRQHRSKPVTPTRSSKGKAPLRADITLPYRPSSIRTHERDQPAFDSNPIASQISQTSTPHETWFRSLDPMVDNPNAYNSRGSSGISRQQDVVMQSESSNRRLGQSNDHAQSPNSPAQGNFPQGPDTRSIVASDQQSNNQTDHPSDTNISTISQSRVPDPRPYVTVDELAQHMQTIRQTLHAEFQQVMETMARALHNRRTPRSPNQSLPRERRRGHLPVHREPERVDLAESVREHFAHLLGRGLMATVSEAEARGYANTWNVDQGQTTPPSTSPEAFRIHLRGKPRSPWNRSAGEVFVRHYMISHNVQWTQENIKKIHDATTTRIKTLIAAYRRSLQDPAVKRDATIRERRATRKHGLFVMRLEAASSHPLTRRHVPLLEDLGTEGMSSDESDHDDAYRDTVTRARSPRYYVRRPRWRSQQAVGWLQVFDFMHLITRRTSDDLRGAYPRLRIRDNLQPLHSNSTRFVAGLPINLYNEAWLTERRDAEVTVYPSPEVHDLNHDPEIFQFIRFHQ